MSELKSYIAPTADGTGLADYYLKSEADKVIAELEESHKKEVGQLLIEIVKLKDSLGKLLKSKTEQVMDEVLQKCLIYGEGFVPAEHAMRLVAELRHNKYKRCLAMAWWCEATALWCYQAASTLPAGFHATLYGKPVMIEPDRLFKRHVLLTKWSARWLEIAEKFEEAK